MRLTLSLLLSLVLSASFGQGAFRALTFRDKEYTAPSLSAPSFASIGDYQTGRDLIAYKPRGHDQASAGSLPLMMMLIGDGVRGDWTKVDDNGEGLGYFLSQGDWDDLTYGHIVVILQLTVADVNYGTADFDDALTQCTAAGLKYDPNRISVTGLSRGAIGVDAMLVGRYSQIACAIPVSGPSTTSGWTNYGGIGFWAHIGTNDANFGTTNGGTLYWANGGFSAANDFKPAPRASYYYTGATNSHAAAIWDGHVYNPASAEYNLFQYAAKFNKDATLQATQFTDNAESTLDIVDYRESKRLVDALSSGAPKTALLSRLSTLLTTINQGGNRYYINPQPSGYTAVDAKYNTWTSFTAASSVTNIIDNASGASTIDVTMTNQCAATNRDGGTSTHRANEMQAHGFDDYHVNEGGFRIETAVNNGRITISQIPTGKEVDVFIYSYHEATNDDQTTAFTADNQLQVICNSVTKTQYVAYNNYRSLSFLNVPESSGNITIDFDALGTREVLITMIELLVHD